MIKDRYLLDRRIDNDLLDRIETINTILKSGSAVLKKRDLRIDIIRVED